MEDELKMFVYVSVYTRSVRGKAYLDNCGINDVSLRFLLLDFRKLVSINCLAVRAWKRELLKAYERTVMRPERYSPCCFERVLGNNNIVCSGVE